MTLTAVDDVSFAVHDGHMTGFVGGNGAGKTTTMRMTMGLLGIDAGRCSGTARRSRPRTVSAPGTCPRSGALSEAEDRRPARLPRRTVRHVGERRQGRDHGPPRALRARGPGQRPGREVEPGQPAACPDHRGVDDPSRGTDPRRAFSGLDPTAVDSMADLLREHTSRGIPVLFSSHQLDLVERLCDHLVVLARVGSSPTAPLPNSATAGRSGIASSSAPTRAG